MSGFPFILDDATFTAVLGKGMMKKRVAVVEASKCECLAEPRFFY